MRTLLPILFLTLLATASKAQTISTFESLSLPKAKDTAYINYSNYGQDVGFSDGLAYFPCVYDTSWGYEFWSRGFAYSNYTDSVTSGFGNQYAAKTGIGFAGSSNYVVSYGNNNKIILNGAAAGHSVFGMYITNSTYAYNSMRDGDAFSKKFSAAGKDYFRIDIFGYLGGTRKSDSVSFYLADYRFADSSKNYLVKDWQWVDLLKLGKVDSLEFVLHSSDVGSFGMNTPAYFCIDNLITNESALSVKEVANLAVCKLYPNPATHQIFIESDAGKNQMIHLYDCTGKLLQTISKTQAKEAIDIQQLPQGVYHIQVREDQKIAHFRIVKAG